MMWNTIQLRPTTHATMVASIMTLNQCTARASLSRVCRACSAFHGAGMPRRKARRRIRHPLAAIIGLVRADKAHRVYGTMAHGGDSMALASQASASWVGEAAPDFEVETTEGRTQRLIDYRGRPLLFGFFPLAFTGG